MTTTKTPEDLRSAWARVFAYAWQKPHKDFLRKLNKDPRRTITEIAQGGEPKHLLDACKVILHHVDSPNSEEGFLALPPLSEGLKGGLSEEQLYSYAMQDGLYGVLRVT